MTDERRDCPLQRAFGEHSTDSDDDLQDEWASCASEDDSSCYGAVKGHCDSGETRNEDVKMSHECGKIAPGKDFKMSPGCHKISSEHVGVGYSCGETRCEDKRPLCSLKEEKYEVVKTRSDYGERRGEDVKTSHDAKASHLEETRNAFDKSVSQSDCYSTCLESVQNSHKLDQVGIEHDHTCSCLTRTLRISDHACPGRDVVGPRSGQKLERREDCPHHSCLPSKEQNSGKSCGNI